MRVILIGGGKTVYFLAKQFASKGYHTTVINRDWHEAERLSRTLAATIVLGDGSVPAILEDAGVRRADVVVALTPHDQDNLIACQIAQRTFGVSRTIALVNDPENETIFHRLGVTVAVSPTQIISTLIEEQADFDDVVNLIPAAGGRVNVTEVTLREDSPAAGVRLKDIDLPANALVGTVIRGERVLIPSGGTRLEVSDRLLMITQPDTFGDAIRALTGEEA